MSRKNIVLVIGARGFAARTMISFLLKEGEAVRAMDFGLERPKALEAEVEYAGVDYSRPENLAAAFVNTQSVYNFALHSGPGRITLREVGNLCNEALRAEVRRFIHISSAAVYGPEPLELPARETTPLNPKTIYEYTFANSEEVVRDFMAQGLKAIILRPMPIYGPGAVTGVNRLIAAVSTGLAPVISRDTAKTRIHFIHAADLARAAHFLSGQRKSLEETYNVADDVVRTFGDIVNQVCDITGVPQPAFHPPRQIVDWGAKMLTNMAHATGSKPLVEPETLELMNHTCILDNFKLKSLGFRFEWPDSGEGFKQTVEWLREHGYLRNPLRLLVSEP